MNGHIDHGFSFFALLNCVCTVLQCCDRSRDYSALACTALSLNRVCGAGIHSEPGASFVCRVHHAQHCLWHPGGNRQCFPGSGDAFARPAAKEADCPRILDRHGLLLCCAVLLML